MINQTLNSNVGSDLQRRSRYNVERDSLENILGADIFGSSSSGGETGSLNIYVYTTEWKQVTAAYIFDGVSWNPVTLVNVYQ